MTTARFPEIHDSAAISRTTISDQVFNQLRKSIFLGKFQPGEPLKELALASEFGVSQASVRVALQLLSQEGLVVRMPHRGTCITNFTPDEMLERVKVRIKLESYAATEAKQHADDASLNMLRKMAEEIDGAVKAKVPRSEIAGRDFEFHKTLWKISGNRTLAKMLEQLCAPLFVFVVLKLLPYGERFHERIHRHLTIVEALEHSSPDEIQQTMQEHVLSGGHPFIGDSIDWGP